MTVVRFAATIAMHTSAKASGIDRYPFHLDSKHMPPDVRLAHVPGAQGDNCLMGRYGMEKISSTNAPGLLVSYVYLDGFLKARHNYVYRDWVMDSGAFSAHNSGTEIKLQDYIDCCKRLMDEDPTLTEIYALDAIGDWKTSKANTEEMWKQGVPAIPCFHVGEPEDVLAGYAKDYPKIALGGMVGRPFKILEKFVGQAFARIWPKKVHGFGLSAEKLIMGFPFHSVDSTSWELGPCAFGRWRSFGGLDLRIRGSKQDLRSEVEWFMKLERKAARRWKREMQLLEDIDADPNSPLADKVKATKFSPGIHLADIESGRMTEMGKKIKAAESKKEDPG